MAGHNKWSQIKHKKSKTDAVKGKVFSKIAREIVVAAKQGGGDPEMNPTLRLIIQKAKQANMPRENIERAIQKGLGGGQDTQMEYLTYEAYAPGGVALVIECLTDNKNRTASNVRVILSKAGASLAAAGSVKYLFNKKGHVYLQNVADPEALMDVVLSAGAEDVEVEEENNICIVSNPDNFESVHQTVLAQDYDVLSAAIENIPDTTVLLESDKAEKLLKLIDALENDDDVQEVYGNYEIASEDLERYS